MIRIIRNLTLIALTAVTLHSIHAEDFFEDQFVKRRIIAYEDLTTKTKKEIQCLADNIYFEARGESELGMKAVAYTTLNRVEDGRWSNSICGVVKQKNNGTCQFSWICDISLLRHRKDEQLYKQCKDIAVAVYLDYTPGLDEVTHNSVFYHADYVQPHWKNLQKTVQIGRHIFYKSV